jgi:hypothetical protein
MKKLTILLSALVVLGLCSFSSVHNMMAPDCTACLTNDGWSDPGEPWAVEGCMSLTHGFCGYANMCGPGTTNICYWHTCHVEYDGCVILYPE